MELSKICGRDGKELKEAGGIKRRIIITSVTQRNSDCSYHLELRLKMNCKEKMNYYVPIQQDEAYE